MNRKLLIKCAHKSFDPEEIVQGDSEIIQILAVRIDGISHFIRHFRIFDYSGASILFTYNAYFLIRADLAKYLGTGFTS